jgi:hypothetical protein
MILAFALWLIVFSAAAGYGRLLLQDSADGGAFTRIYAGLLTLSAILLAAGAFTNLTPTVGLIAALPGITLYWRDRDPVWRLRYYGPILALVALAVSFREINFYDTGLYHEQAVKWLAEHGLVRGVALVNFRFGFVSSWFALAAPLDHGIAAGRAGIIGGLPLVLCVATSSQIVNALHRPMQMTGAILGAMLSVVAIVWHVDTSLSPDMMVWLLPLIVVTVLADSTATGADRVGRATLVAALACLLKSTVAPVFLYCSALLVWRFVREAEDRRRLASFAAAAAGVMLVLIGANLIASGCPAFPSPVGCAPLEWSVGSDAARSVQADVVNFARTSRHGQIVPLTALAALASLLLGAASRTVYARHILGVSWVGIAFTWMVAPVPRYALGYFLLPVAGLIAAALNRVPIAKDWAVPMKGWVRASAWMSATAAIAALLFVNGTREWLPWLYPHRIASVNGDPIHIVNRAMDMHSALALRTEQRGELTIWVPASSDQCWDAPLPCTPNLTRGDVRLRNKGNFDTGFLTP